MTKKEWMRKHGISEKDMIRIDVANGLKGKIVSVEDKKK
jgi:hypothetical protein